MSTVTSVTKNKLQCLKGSILAQTWPSFNTTASQLTKTVPAREEFSLVLTVLAFIQISILRASHEQIKLKVHLMQRCHAALSSDTEEN